MKQYANPDSCVKEYQYGGNEENRFIDLRYENHIFTFNYLIPGKDKVDEMIRLADIGKGLCSYVMTFSNSDTPNHFKKTVINDGKYRSINDKIYSDYGFAFDRSEDIYRDNDLYPQKKNAKKKNKDSLY